MENIGDMPIPDEGSTGGGPYEVTERFGLGSNMGVHKSNEGSTGGGSYKVTERFGSGSNMESSSGASSRYISKVRENFPMFNKFDDDTPIRLTDKQIELLIERYPNIIDLKESEVIKLWEKIQANIDQKGTPVGDKTKFSKSFDDFYPRTLELLDPKNEISFAIQEEMKSLNIGDFLTEEENHLTSRYFTDIDPSADISQTYINVFEQINLALFLTERFRDLAVSGLSPINWGSYLKEKYFKDIKHKDNTIADVCSVLMAVRNNKVKWDYGLTKTSAFEGKYGVSSEYISNREEEITEERKKFSYSDAFKYLGGSIGNFFSSIYSKIGRSNSKDKIKERIEPSLGNNGGLVDKMEDNEKKLDKRSERSLGKKIAYGVSGVAGAGALGLLITYGVSNYQSFLSSNQGETSNQEATMVIGDLFDYTTRPPQYSKPDPSSVEEQQTVQITPKQNLETFIAKINEGNCPVQADMDNWSQEMYENSGLKELRVELGEALKTADCEDSSITYGGNLFRYNPEKETLYTAEKTFGSDVLPNSINNIEQALNTNPEFASSNFGKAMSSFIPEYRKLNE